MPRQKQGFPDARLSGHWSQDQGIRPPRYCRHKATGQGIVYIGGREIYLGPYGSPAGMRLYDQIVARWRVGDLAGARSIGAELSVAELVAHFARWAAGRYSKTECSSYGSSTRRLCRLYADCPVSEFGPLALQAVRRLMVADGLCRKTANDSVHRLRHIWRWGVGNELIAETLWRALLAVPALARGEGGVRESEPVRPARWRQLRAVLRRAPAMVRVMVRVQILTGMRPGELVKLRPADLDRSRDVWLYRLAEHKTLHHGKTRIVQIGPRARRLLEPLLGQPGLDAEAFVFRPSESAAAYDARRKAASGHASPAAPVYRQTAVRLAQARQRGSKPRQDGPCYSVDSYRRAIQRACEAEYPMPAELARRPSPATGGRETVADWQDRLGEPGRAALAAWRKKYLLFPHQLRHSFATRVGNRFGEEAAQKLLGHARLSTTAIYVERDLRQGRAVIARIG